MGTDGVGVGMDSSSKETNAFSDPWWPGEEVVEDKGMPGRMTVKWSESWQKLMSHHKNGEPLKLQGCIAGYGGIDLIEPLENTPESVSVAVAEQHNTPERPAFGVAAVVDGGQNRGRTPVHLDRLTPADSVAGVVDVRSKRILYGALAGVPHLELYCHYHNHHQQQ
ncbi:hypothetical protein EC957_010590 [Mortierella hygrophila]|uniref:Uncharacterized protein n=1 Tax=Mortierella hygrophila TaxID=979708 RepID=A0A9P6FA97_9FUNG|nr:hypothetical protein EC957_010590 [Mortierella hygrophila]